MHEVTGIDLFSSDCHIRYIVTVQALAEGWDCSFAYVLFTVANLNSATAVEQILGRVLRMPYGRPQAHPELCRAYAIATSDSFSNTANTLADALVENGFERFLAQQVLVTSPLQLTPEQIRDRTTQVSQPPIFSSLPASVRSSINFNPADLTLTLLTTPTEWEQEHIRNSFTSPQDRELVDELCARLRATGTPTTSVEPRRPVTIPQLTIELGSGRHVLDDSLLQAAWGDISDETLVAVASEELSISGAQGGTGTIDVGNEGRISIRSLSDDLAYQQSLLEGVPNWSLRDLALWIDRSISHPDLPREQAVSLINSTLNLTLVRQGVSLERLITDRFRLRSSVARVLDRLRSNARKIRWDRLIEDSQNIAVDSKVVFEYRPEVDFYPATSFYEGRYVFQSHFYPKVGELGSNGEEFDCACLIDSMAEVDTWVRNLSRRSSTSFWLQTSTDKFFPDFVARLKDERILVVEYKRRSDMESTDTLEKSRLGNVWATGSSGKCLFAVVTAESMDAVLRRLVFRPNVPSST
ncbi:MAG TPA: hypothetical protein VFO25_00060 [Candidatus Eremiobacteraceae bacterium]|nr:hypothetical protein [Candidatus Eremiobacteraceae bacterium]